MTKKLFYGLRWQIAGIVYPVPVAYLGVLWGTIVGSLIGAIVFWHVDKYLTKEKL